MVCNDRVSTHPNSVVMGCRRHVAFPVFRGVQFARPGCPRAAANGTLTLLVVIKDARALSCPEFQCLRVSSFRCENHRCQMVVNNALTSNDLQTPSLCQRIF